MKTIDKFERIIQKMDDKKLEEMTKGLVIFTKLCIDNKFKHQRNAVIDFALTARNTYIDRVLEQIRENKELPY